MDRHALLERSPSSFLLYLFVYYSGWKAILRGGYLLLFAIATDDLHDVILFREWAVDGNPGR